MHSQGAASSIKTLWIHIVLNMQVLAYAGAARWGMKTMIMVELSIFDQMVAKFALKHGNLCLSMGYLEIVLQLQAATVIAQSSFSDHCCCLCYETPQSLGHSHALSILLAWMPSIELLKKLTQS